MGVVFARFADDDKIIAVAKNSERNLEAEGAEAPEEEPEAGEIQTGKDESVDE
jgi:DNA gyrase subunit A